MKGLALLFVLSSGAAAFTLPTKVSVVGGRVRTSTRLYYSDSDPYRTLGVSRNVDMKGIKDAYRKLAKEYHPGELNLLPRALSSLL